MTLPRRKQLPTTAVLNRDQLSFNQACPPSMCALIIVDRSHTYVTSWGLFEGLIGSREATPHSLLVDLPKCSVSPGGWRRDSQLGRESMRSDDLNLHSNRKTHGAFWFCWACLGWRWRGLRWHRSKRTGSCRRLCSPNRKTTPTNLTALSRPSWV